MNQLHIESSKQFKHFIAQGKQFRANQDLDQASEQFSLALDLKPNSIIALKQMAEIYLLKEELDNAIICYQKIIKLKPESANSYCTLAHLLVQQGNVSDAIVAYQKATELRPKLSEKLSSELGNKIIQQGDTLLKQRQWEQAEVCYRQVLKIDPNNYQAYFHLGDLIKYQGNLDEAIDFYIKSARIQPGFQPAYMRFTHYIKYGKLSSRSLDKVTKLVENQTKECNEISKMKSLLSLALAQQGRVKESIESNQKLIYQMTQKRQPYFAKNHWNNSTQGKPNFLVIGYMKCGTTALYDYIVKHPKIIHCREKEIKFFSNDSLYNLGIQWYLSNFPPIPENSGYMTGEASPNYVMGGLRTAQRVFDAFPDMKLIVILRNPIKRALSHYYFALKRGAKYRTFEEVISIDIKRFEKKIKKVDNITNMDLFSGAVLSGLYVYPLKQWMQIFPREQFLILKNEDLAKDTSATMNKVFEFLGVSTSIKGRYPRKNSGSYDPMTQEQYNRLLEFYKPHNQKLEDFLDMQFDWD